MATAARKQRRTYSLDPELVRYVDTVRRESRMESASSALEKILRASKQQRERKQQDQKIARYYSSLNHSELEQESAWGAFAETQFPTE
jgi:metal-responsive CopG/Arc/MetJ family transcriptional regulator